MNNKKFESFLQKYNEEVGSYQPLKESVDSIILVSHLVERDVTNNLLCTLNEGAVYSTKHLATKQDLEEIGVKVETDYCLFDKPTSFTVPVLVPEKH